MALAARHVPETRDEHATGRLDWLGGATLAAGLVGVVYVLIEGPGAAWSAGTVAAGLAGAALLVAFVVIEHVRTEPMVPLALFANRQFSGANITTVFVYAALGAVFFLVTVHLQTDLGYSPLAAGASFIPLTLIMLAFSARSGRLAQRIGPTVPMTAGPLIMAAGVALLARIQPGTTYVGAVLPAVLVLGGGLASPSRPSPPAVLGAVADDHAGIGSAVNNAVARLGSLLAVAVLPAAAGLTGAGGTLNLEDGFARAMLITAALPVCGALAAALTVRRVTPVASVVHGPVSQPCLDPCLAESPATAA